MYKFLGVTLLLQAVFVLGGRVSFEDCGGTYELEEVSISGCDRTAICDLAMNEVVNVTALITPSGEQSTSLLHGANLVLNNIQTALDVSPDACVASPCPINSQIETVYAAQFVVPTSIALNTRGSLEWKIWNNSGNMIVCFRVTIRTTASQYDVLRRLMENLRAKNLIK